MKSTIFKPLDLILAAVLGLSAVGANAQFFDDRDARKAILELRQRMESDKLAAASQQARLLEEVRKSSDENVALRGIVLDLQSQMQALRDDIARSRGQNENLARGSSELQKRNQEMLAALDERLRKFEPAKVVVDGREFLADPQEKREFEASLDLFRKGNFESSQAGFSDFVRRHPASGFTPSALFWLGNAQYATRDYKGSVANLRSMIAAAPDHSRVPDAMLALANSQIELTDTTAARKTLEDLTRAHPQSEAASSARDRLSRLK